MKKVSQESSPLLSLVKDTLRLKKQALVFCNTKRGAEKAAEDCAKKIKETTPEQLAEKILGILASPTKQCRRLARSIEKGMAFHHAGLHQKQREIIEDAFREGNIKIICSTPTLAAGVDLPAFRTILRDVKRFGRRGLQYIPVLEYLQMAGRSGRPKYDKKGEAIMIAASEGDREELIERYVKGVPEPILSKLAVEPVLRTYLLSLIASRMVRNRSQLLAFFEKTFWAHQYEDFFRLEQKIDSMVALLAEWGMIQEEGEDTDFVSADRLQDHGLRATPVGKRVAELYLDPLTAYLLIQRMRRTSQRKVADFSWLQMVSHTLEMAPLLRVRVKDQEMIEDALVQYDGSLLDLEPTMYDFEYQEFQNSIKTALFLLDWISEKDEEYLLETYGIRPGEIKVKLDLADWLLYASGELGRILGFLPLLKDLQRMRVRLKYGVKEELLSLLRFRGIGRVRARKLHDNRIRTVADVKHAELGKLMALIGKAAARSLKTQVGENIPEEVKTNKRKGQINLKDY